jgi:hypothetical protein
MTERKSPMDRALDLFVYAPLGLVLNIEEVLPELVERGHQQVNMARMFGQFAVQTGTKEARKRLEGLSERGRPAAPPVPTATPNPARAPEVTEVPVAVEEDGAAIPGAGELAIPDYDSLSASQVVPRLDGLSADERDAVRRYEGAHRGRKTILSKLNQLH